MNPHFKFVSQIHCTSVLSPVFPSKGKQFRFLLKRERERVWESSSFQKEVADFFLFDDCHSDSHCNFGVSLSILSESERETVENHCHMFCDDTLTSGFLSLLMNKSVFVITLQCPFSLSLSLSLILVLLT